MAVGEVNTKEPVVPAVTAAVVEVVGASELDGALTVRTGLEVLADGGKMLPAEVGVGSDIFSLDRHWTSWSRL